MASKAAVATALAYLSELFPTRPITDATLSAWTDALATVPDAALMPAMKAVATQPGRTFFPTPGELIAAAPNRPAADVDRLVWLLGGLAEYTPHGIRPPTTEAIAADFGPEVAVAVAAVGAGRLLCGSEEDSAWAKKELRQHLANLPTLDQSVPVVGGPRLTLPQIRAERAATAIGHGEGGEGMAPNVRAVLRAVTAQMGT